MPSPESPSPNQASAAVRILRAFRARPYRTMPQKIVRTSHYLELMVQQLVTANAAALAVLQSRQDDTPLSHDEALLSLRETSTMIVSEALRLRKWCNGVVAPYSPTRFHVATMRPRRIGTGVAASLYPPIAKVYVRSVPLQAGAPTMSACGLAATWVLFLDGYSAWWLCLFAILSWPGVLFLLCCFERSTLKKLMRTFQNLFVFGATLVMMVTLSVLWRHHPAKIIGLWCVLPNFLVAMFMDAYPEGGRLSASRVFFGATVVFLVSLQFAIILNWMKLDDYTIDVYVAAPTKVTSMAVGALNGMILFGLKNIAATVLKPGSLAVAKSEVRCVKLSDDALGVAKLGHTLLLSLCAKNNRTLKKEARKANRSGSIILPEVPRKSKTLRPSRVVDAASVPLDSFDAVNPIGMHPVQAMMPEAVLAWLPNLEDAISDSCIDIDSRAETSRHEQFAPHALDGEVLHEGCSRAGVIQVAPPVQGPMTAADALSSARTDLLFARRILQRTTRALYAKNREKLPTASQEQFNVLSSLCISALREGIPIVQSTNAVVPVASMARCHVPSMRLYAVETGVVVYTARVTTVRDVALGSDYIPCCMVRRCEYCILPVVRREHN